MSTSSTCIKLPYIRGDFKQMHVTKYKVLYSTLSVSTENLMA